ncbi:MAG: chorismate synthase [Methanosarcinaceae archaeon]|nr:chorismate synthase [Methanosarcinaceae archaeon]
MTGNTFGHSFRITTWGESHGRALGVVIDGTPAGLPIDEEDIQHDLNRRRPGQSRISTPRSEADHVEILSGVFEGRSTGTPISMLVYNKDTDPSAYDNIKDTPRPGHADYPYKMKYGMRDHRGGGRSSARETIGRVAAGAVARKLLRTAGIEIVSHVIELGGVRAKDMNMDLDTMRTIQDNVDKTIVRCADLNAAEEMIAQADAARQEGDSIGGIVETIVVGVPAGLGEPVFDKLDADIAKAMMSIGAVKGVEIGAGFKAAELKGSHMNDGFAVENGTVVTRTNNAGGILGGLSSGMPIICRCAVKPTPSISITQRSMDMKQMSEQDINIQGRHDPTIPPRMVPVAEAMMALVLADHMIRSGHIGPNTLLKG